MALVNILLGVSVLILGRPLFWAFVAGAGFVGGMLLSSHFFGDQWRLEVLAIAIVCGLIGALVSLFLHRLAIRLGGFIAGAYITFSLLPMFYFGDELVFWSMVGLGGLLGLLLVAVLFDWALICLTAFAGATMVIQAVQGFPSYIPDPRALVLLFFVLFLVGVAIQGHLLKRSGSRKNSDQ